jgi:hypothetical protein
MPEVEGKAGGCASAFTCELGTADRDAGVRGGIRAAVSSSDRIRKRNPNMALVRRVKQAGSKKRMQVEALELSALDESKDANAESQDPVRREDPTLGGGGETQRGALLMLGLGGTFVLMGLALIIGRELGYTGRVSLLSAIGLTAGGFVFSGLTLCACSLVLRSFAALSQRLDDLEMTQNTRIKRAIHAAASGAISEESEQIWKDLDENVRALMACREGEREESSRSANFIRDAEIKIDTIKRTLEETHRRVLEVHHQVGEGLGDTSVAELGPQLKESLERMLHERSNALSQEMRTQNEKALVRTQEKMDALAAQVQKHVEKGGKSDGATLDLLKKELERTRGELTQSIEQLAAKGSDASPQVTDLKQDLREVLRRCEQIERELKSAPRMSAPVAASAPSPAPVLAASPAPAMHAAEAPVMAAAAPASSGSGEMEPAAGIASAIARLRQMKP